MLTKKDRQTLAEDFKQIFVTKNEFETRFIEHEAKLATAFEKFRSEMITRLDRLLGKSETIETEQVVSAHVQSKHTQQLENHEHRLNHLEEQSH